MGVVGEGGREFVVGRTRRRRRVVVWMRYICMEAWLGVRVDVRRSGVGV